MLKLKNVLGAPRGLRGLRIWHGHCRGLGSIPGSGTCMLQVQPKKKKKKRLYECIQILVFIGFYKNKELAVHFGEWMQGSSGLISHRAHFYQRKLPVPTCCMLQVPGW